MVAVVPPNPLPPDEDCGPALLVLSSVLISFIILTSGIRLWVRWRNHILGWDDCTIAIVTVLALLRFACQIIQLRHGNGRHRWYISAEDYTISNMWGWLAQILLFAGVCFLKVSICLLILRIKNDPWLKWLLYGVMAGLAVTNGAVIIILLAECDPVEAYWKGNGVCWDARVRIYSIYFTIAYSILTDLLCSLLPLVVVWNVRIAPKLKALVSGLMSLGLVATGFGIARAASLGIVTNDLTWTYCISAIWSNCELFLGIIAANLAVSRTVYLHFWGDPNTTQLGQGSGSFGNSASARSARSADQLAKLRNDRLGLQETVIESRVRRNSEYAKSEASDIPLEPGIQKRTEFWLEEDVEGAAGKSETSVGHSTR